MIGALAHGGSGIAGADLALLVLSASPPFIAAAWWLRRRSRKRAHPDEPAG